MTNTEQESSLDESLDFNIVCGWGQCENDAEWFVTKRCCNQSLFHCQYHKEYFENKLREFFKNKPFGFCPDCRTPAIKMEDYYRYEKI